ncbi:MAG: AmmeMemoRadiSam system protein B [Candidatus Paceibacterota bacterium]|jgi:poly-gamma-glutamate synthesis protein (capsule biosynthesis protein)
MKIQSSLSNAKTKIILLFLLTLLILWVALGLVSVKSNGSEIIYHQSQLNEYAPEIERVVKAEQSVQPLNLEHIYGGVMSHHIPTTIPQLVEFYSRLKRTQSVRNFIVIGPDHTDAGKAPITISNASFFTAYGEVRPIDGLASKLQDAKLANIDESPFDPEHSVGSQILVISKIFPGAKVTPIILRSNTTKNHAEALGKMLATLIDDETVLIASVDFSHYLPTDQAMPLDQISGGVVRNLDLEALSLVTADSGKSMAVFMGVMNEKKAVDTDDLIILNTNDLMQNSDYTTGYVFGFWGIKNKASSQNNSNETSTLIFVGDIMLSRGINNIMNKNSDWHYPFLKTTDFLKNADLTFGNLEGPISRNGTKVGSIYSFEADPRSVEGLLYSGFDVLSVANNHIWDYGAEAFRDTLKILKDNGISYIGGGSSYEEAHTPVVREIRGTKIAYLGYTNLLPPSLGSMSSKPAIAFSDKDQIILDVQKAKTLADVVIVSFHWGDEYETHHNSFQENLAHISVNAGADLVVGHHPHVVQEVEKYNDGYIAYSLGNFVFDQNFSDDTKSGLLLTVVLKNKKIEEIKEQKIEFTYSYQPFLVSQ